MLPVLLMGNTSINKLVMAANKIKFSFLFPRKNLKFLKIKITNNNPSIDAIKKFPVKKGSIYLKMVNLF